MRREHDVCTVGTCRRPHKARGMCQTHYMQFKRGVPVVETIRVRVHEKPEECSEPDCHESVKSRGLCGMHYQRTIRHGFTAYRDRKKPPKICRIEGCDNHLYANGVCHPHYAFARKWGRFGLTVEKHQEMLNAQRGVCAICQEPETALDGVTGKVRQMAVDHRHTTNRVRGLLCTPCNRALGLMKDSPNILRRAATYLENDPD